MQVLELQYISECRGMDHMDHMDHMVVVAEDHGSFIFFIVT